MLPERVAARDEPDREVVVGRDDLEPISSAEQVRERVLGEAEVVVRVTVRRKGLVRLHGPGRPPTLSARISSCAASVGYFRCSNVEAEMITSKRSVPDRVGQPVQVGDDVHIRPGLDVRAEELGGVPNPVAVHRRAPRLRLQRPQLEHARRLELGAAGAEPPLQLRARLAVRAWRAEQRDGAAQAPGARGADGSARPAPGPRPGALFRRSPSGDHARWLELRAPSPELRYAILFALGALLSGLTIRW